MAVIVPQATPQVQASAVQIYSCLATGGGAAANMTIASGSGIASVAYNAATGKYLVTLNQIPTTTTGATLIGAHGTILGATGDNPDAASVNIVKGSYSSAAGTIQVEIFNAVTGTVALADLATTKQLSLTLILAS